MVCRLDGRCLSGGKNARIQRRFQQLCAVVIHLLDNSPKDTESAEPGGNMHESALSGVYFGVAVTVPDAAAATDTDDEIDVAAVDGADDVALDAVDDLSSVTLIASVVGAPLPALLLLLLLDARTRRSSVTLDWTRYCILQ